jgi:hypothetical protein
VAYERASKSAHVPPQLRDLLRASLADARRHRGWLEEQLEGEEPPYASPGGPSI